MGANTDVTEVTYYNNRTLYTEPHNPLGTYPHETPSNTGKGETGDKGAVKPIKSRKGGKGYYIDKKGKGAQQTGPLRAISELRPNAGRLPRTEGKNQHTR